MQNIVKRETIEYIAAIIFLIGFISFLFITPPKKEQAYDCSISEISPDYPLEVKEQCRKLRAENYQKNLQKPK